MFKPTYLYIKTHNVTGLKYFGKTTKENPYRYRGSGKNWTKHIKEYGNDVTTEIIGYFLIEEECKEFATKFSKENDIVKSSEWANLKIEDGLDRGGSPFLYPEIYSETLLNEWRNKAKEKHKEWREKTDLCALNKASWDSGNNKGSTGYKHSKEAKKNISRSASLKQKGEKNSQYGTTWVWNKEEGNKKIKKELLQEYLDKGWEKKYIPGYRI